MAEALRGKFTGVDLDSLVDQRLVKVWLYWGMFWLMLTPTFGVTISAMFNFPDYLPPALELTFGRLRPVHVNGVIFGAFSTLFIGLCHYLVPRLCGVRVWGEKLGMPLVWIWNFGLIAGLASLAMGWNQGLEAGEFPLAIDIVIFVIVTITTHAIPHHHRAAAGAAALCRAVVPDLRLRLDGAEPDPGQLHHSVHHRRREQRGVPWPLHPLHRRIVADAGGLCGHLLFPAAQRAAIRSTATSFRWSGSGRWPCSIRSSASITISTRRSPTGRRRSPSSPPCC